MEIRQALPGDIPAVAALEAEIFPLGSDAAALERMRSDPDCPILCAVEAGTLLGYVYFRSVLDEGYVGDLAVRGDRRRRGIGRALIAAMCAEAERRKLAFLTLEVRESNAAARRLYESCGFLPVGVRKNYYEKPRENAVLMTRTFPRPSGGEG